MSLVRLNIKGISYSQTQNGAYALILNEVEGDRKLPIIIGAFEAQSIAIALEKEIKPPRPLTHDLFKNFADRYDIFVKQVIIHKLVDGVFYSSIICEGKGVEEIIDARTSDAIALALRFNAPIFTYKDILESAGVYLKAGGKEDNKPADTEKEEALIDDLMTGGDSETVKSKSEDFSKFSDKELNNMLGKAVANEDYERAAQLRDELSKRK